MNSYDLIWHLVDLLLKDREEKSNVNDENEG